MDLNNVLDMTIKRVKATKGHAEALKAFDLNPSEATHMRLKAALLERYICDDAILGNYEIQTWIKALDSEMVRGAKQMRVHQSDTHILYIQRGRREGERAYLTVKKRGGS